MILNICCKFKAGRAAASNNNNCFLGDTRFTLFVQTVVCFNNIIPRAILQCKYTE